MKDLHFKQVLRLPLVGRFHLNVLEYIHFSAFLTSWSVGRVSYASVLSPPQIRSACTSSAIMTGIDRKKGLPWWLSGKESAWQCKRGWFNPWVRKMTPLPCPRRRKWQSTPVFLPGESHGQRSLVGYSPLGHKRVGYDLATKQQKERKSRERIESRGHESSKPSFVHNMMFFFCPSPVPLFPQRHFSLILGESF